MELTTETWPLLEELFGPNGAQSGCWCTWFSQTNAEMRANGSAGNKDLLHARVRAEAPVAGFEVVERRGPSRALVRLVG